MLLETNVASTLLTMEEINRSIGPIGVPLATRNCLMDA
jgi:hypothetical protein